MERLPWFGDLTWRSAPSFPKNSIAMRRNEQDSGCWFRGAVQRMFGIHPLDDVVLPV
jgi:hypothetical protein